MGKISEVRPLRFLLLCRWMILLKPLAADFVCWPAGCFPASPAAVRTEMKTQLSARAKYIFSHLCPQRTLSESPSLNTVMNRGISGGKVFYKSPDVDLSTTLDFFTYLDPRRSRIRGRAVCVRDKQQQDANRGQDFAGSLSPPDPSVAMNNKCAGQSRYHSETAPGE